MIRGLYSAAAGMLSTQLAEGVVGDNLANSGVSGFKEQLASFTAYAPESLVRLDAGSATPIGGLSSGAIIGSVSVNWSPGTPVPSTNPLAVALTGGGFFGLQTASGVQYTRAGDFSFNGSGTLVNPGGAAVLGTNGQPIQLPAGQSATGARVSALGVVTAGAHTLGHLAVFQPTLAALLPQGQGLYTLAPGTAAPVGGTGVMQPGYLEQSNVDTVRQMASLMQLQQAFTADQRSVQVAQQTASTAISQVGTVS